MVTMGDLVAVAERMDVAPDSSVGVERAPTREEMTELLKSVAATARPRRSSLRALAQVVRVLRRCPWLDGELRMELAPDGEQTAVHLYVERGAIRERVLVPVHFPLAFEEVDWGVAEVPELFAPLKPLRHEGRLIVSASGTAATTLAPRVEVAGESTPHEAPTVKRPAYVLPEAYPSGKHHRRGSEAPNENE
jgi:hypothetical protein